VVAALLQEYEQKINSGDLIAMARRGAATCTAPMDQRGAKSYS